MTDWKLMSNTHWTILIVHELNQRRKDITWNMLTSYNEDGVTVMVETKNIYNFKQEQDISKVRLHQSQLPLTIS